jgi:hypothetical protein
MTGIGLRLQRILSEVSRSVLAMPLPTAGILTI